MLRALVAIRLGLASEPPLKKAKETPYPGGLHFDSEAFIRAEVEGDIPYISISRDFDEVVAFLTTIDISQYESHYAFYRDAIHKLCSLPRSPSRGSLSDFIEAFSRILGPFSSHYKRYFADNRSLRVAFEEVRHYKRLLTGYLSSLASSRAPELVRPSLHFCKAYLRRLFKFVDLIRNPPTPGVDAGSGESRMIKSVLKLSAEFVGEAELRNHREYLRYRMVDSRVPGGFQVPLLSLLEINILELEDFKKSGLTEEVAGCLETLKALVTRTRAAQAVKNHRETDDCIDAYIGQVRLLLGVSKVD